MSDKEWVCPCTGCSKARKKAFTEIESIINENGSDMIYAWHQITMLVNKELRTPNKAPKK